MKLFFHRAAYYIIVFSVIFNAFIVNAEALNFEQIKQKALNNNPGLSAGNSAVKAAEAEILQAGAILTRNWKSVPRILVKMQLKWY